MIEIVYFGRLRDDVGCAREALVWHGGSTADLLHQLRSRNAQYAQALAPQRVFRLAVNRRIMHGDALIPDGAEVGILPPVTGG